MKSVLIPTDFSENSKNAMAYAMEFFADCSIHFYILHVHNSVTASKDSKTQVLHAGDGTPTSLSKQSLLEEELASYRLLRKNVNHQFSSVSSEGSLVETIRSQVLEKEIDLIVMGTKGSSLIDADEMGSNTYAVITKVKCPILVVPVHARMEANNTVAFFTDYHNIYRNKVVKTLSVALQLFKAPLRILHLRPKNVRLTPGQVDNKGFLHYFFRDFNHTFHFMENENIEEGVQEFVDDWEISVIALAAKNLNFIQRLMLRPFSERASYHTEIPFLVLHE